MFRDVPGCSGMFHVPAFIDDRLKMISSFVCLSNRIKMSKSDIYVPSCHIYVQKCDMYIQIRRPVFVLYITVKWLYIFQYSFDINISWTFLDIHFMRSVFHVSLHDLSRISRAWRWGRRVSRRLCKTATWRREGANLTECLGSHVFRTTIMHCVQRVRTLTLSY